MKILQDKVLSKAYLEGRYGAIPVFRDKMRLVSAGCFLWEKVGGILK